jgi:hypothetical protein
MASTATLVYTATPVVLTAAQLVLKMRNPPAPGATGVILPTSDLLPLGIKLSTDTTIVNAGNAERTIVFSLLPIFTPSIPLSPIPANFGWQGSLVSSDPQDSPNGTGVKQIQLRGSDINGELYTITVAPQGTTPVPLILLTGERIQTGLPARLTPYGAVDLRTVDTLTPQIGTPAGMLSVYSDLRGGKGGNMMFQTFPGAVGWQGSVMSTDDVDTAGPPGGIGLQVLQISSVDNAGAPLADEFIPLQGKTPVPLTALNHGQITNMQVFAAGSLTANLGRVTIFQGLNGTGGVAGTLAPSFSGLFTPANQQAVFKGLYTQILAAEIQTLIVETPPLIA